MAKGLFTKIGEKTDKVTQIRGVKEVTQKVDQASGQFAQTAAGNKVIKYSSLLFLGILSYSYYVVIPHGEHAGEGFGDMPIWLAKVCGPISTFFGYFYEGFGDIVQGIFAVLYILFKLFFIFPYKLWHDYFSSQVGYKSFETGMTDPSLGFFLMLLWMGAYLFVVFGFINGNQRMMKDGIKVIIYMTMVSLIPYAVEAVLGEPVSWSAWSILQAVWDYFVNFLQNAGGAG